MIVRYESGLLHFSLLGTGEMSYHTKAKCFTCQVATTVNSPGQSISIIAESSIDQCCGLASNSKTQTTNPFCSPDTHIPMHLEIFQVRFPGLRIILCGSWPNPLYLWALPLGPLLLLSRFSCV